MAEGFELPETHHEHAEHPLVAPVSITISILAVLVASVTLLSHRAHTEEILLQSQETDQWAYYQAKNIRAYESKLGVTTFTALMPKDPALADHAREAYQKDYDKYSSDKDEIGDKARELESERNLVSRRADRYDGGEALLEIGLVICSITLLTKRKFFWIAGSAIAVAGVIVALTGLFLH